LKESYRIGRHFEIDKDFLRTPRPEFLKVVQIVASAIEATNKNSVPKFETRHQRKISLSRSLILKTIILVPTASYIACGGGGENEKDVQPSNFENIPIPQWKIEINGLDERFGKREEGELVYTDTFRTAEDKIEKYLAEIESALKPQIKTDYVSTFKPPPVEPIHQPPNTNIDGGNKIILTFDDSDSSGVIVSQILDILSQYNAKAIFFPTGNWASGSGAPYVQRMQDEGHLVCNHTRSHANLSKLSEEEIRSEILGGAGVGSCNFLRPPYGAYNAYVSSIAAELGYTIMMWDIDTRDWARRYPGGDQEILNTVLSNAHSGAVVLMHMHVENTLYALPAMLKGLKDAGYELHW